MQREYPKGAITSVEELTFAFLGKPVFHAYGIEKPFIEVMFDCRDLQAIKDGTLQGYRFFLADKEKFIEIGPDRCFLNDVNIGARYNGNYLFYKLSDALAYLRSLGCDYKPGPDLLKYDNYLDTEPAK